MSDVDAARDRWIQERPSYDEFAKLIADRMKVAVQNRGIWCETSSRAKEVHSLVKKLLLKGNHRYDSLPDKAGARCIVRYRSELDEVLSLAVRLFECPETEDKAKALGPDRVGYVSVHVQVKLRQGDPESERYPPDTYSAELQIRTLGQHLWSEMAHDTFYKNEEALVVLPLELRRRAYLMAGLIEVADQEFDRLNRETTLSPEARLYKALEQHYYQLVAKRPDPVLSLEVIRLLFPLYRADVPEITQRLDRFFEDHKGTLQHVYSEIEERTSSPFFYQPEVLMIYERLDADQYATRKAWAVRFPESELERIANPLGISFD